MTQYQGRGKGSVACSGPRAVPGLRLKSLMHAARIEHVLRRLYQWYHNSMLTYMDRGELLFPPRP
jgi:hypothetical protein